MLIAKFSRRAGFRAIPHMRDFMFGLVPRPHEALHIGCCVFYSYISINQTIKNHHCNPAIIFEIDFFTVSDKESVY